MLPALAFEPGILFGRSREEASFFGADEMVGAEMFQSNHLAGLCAQNEIRALSRGVDVPFPGLCRPPFGCARWSGGIDTPCDGGF